jgi:hypothetical protein
MKKTTILCSLFVSIFSIQAQNDSIITRYYDINREFYDEMDIPYSTIDTFENSYIEKSFKCQEYQVVDSAVFQILSTIFVLEDQCYRPNYSVSIFIDSIFISQKSDTIYRIIIEPLSRSLFEKGKVPFGYFIFREQRIFVYHNNYVITSLFKPIKKYVYHTWYANLVLYDKDRNPQYYFMYSNGKFYFYMMTSLMEGVKIWKPLVD